MARIAPVDFASHSPTFTRESSGARPSVVAGVEEPRALAGMLLAATIAALLVVADQVIDSWTDGKLLFAWVALWTLAFATLALLAQPLRKLALAAARACTLGLARARQQSLRARAWELARSDARVMADLALIASRDQD